MPRLRSAARAGLPPSGVRFFDHATANKRYANGIVADDLGRPLKVSETPPLTSDLFACSVMMVERVLPDRVLGVGRGGARWSLFAPLAITSLRERFPQPLKLTEPGNSHGATLSERV
ncbi:MAG: hypothetical protein JNL19_10025 [Burkholderiales bacterium]|nr:hypothetical protein [Burkholderiales bacterium]